MGKLVVIDQDKEARECVAAFGRELGFTVSVCASAKEGLDFIKKQAPEIALVSATLADVSGYEVASKFAYDYSIAVIMMVDREDNFEDETAMTCGVAEIIVKPVRVEELRCRVARARELHTMLRVRERLVNELERLSKTDGLTRLLNARVFFRQLENVASQSVDKNSDLSLLMIDLDHFKALNDKHGHSAGNDVLQDVGTTLRSHMAPGQSAFRFGGEEFTVLLPDCGLNADVALAETLRLSIAELGKTKTRNISVTASIGVGMHDPAESCDAFTARVDAAMYAAKAQGRNRVVVSSGVDTPENTAS
ncbi:MAG: diguanylate cyclase [Verrucomicrobia bacterium]|nr:diguanylate cyclase [Verrucomicrobiota bacterium]